MPSSALVAVDIGNSRVKLGLFDRTAFDTVAAGQLPEPVDTLALPHADRTGSFDVAPLAAWCKKHTLTSAGWLVSSVHRGSSEWLTAAVADLAGQSGRDWPLRFLTHRDVPLVIHLDQPDLLGIDRVVASFAVNQVRDSLRAAVVVDMGTATTVDLLLADGSFEGGAILPGVGTSARALAEHTDVLPLVTLDHLKGPPAPVAKSAVPAIESGLFWGAVGAIRELVNRYADGMAVPPEVFVTGGAARLVAEALATTDGLAVRYVPNLVLGGIALVSQNLAEE